MKIIGCICLIASVILIGCGGVSSSIVRLPHAPNLQSLPQTETVTVWSNRWNKGFENINSNPAKIGQPFPCHYAVASIGVAGKSKIDLVEKARNEARSLGCDGLLLGYPGIQIENNMNFFSAGFIAIKVDQQNGNSCFTTPKAVSLDMWNHFLIQGHEKNINTNLNAHIKASAIAFRKIGEKEIRTGVKDIHVASALLSEYAIRIENGAPRSLSIVEKDLPWDIVDSNIDIIIKESWQNLREIASRNHFPDPGILD